MDKGSDSTWILDFAVFIQSCSLGELSPDFCTFLHGSYTSTESTPKESVSISAPPKHANVHILEVLYEMLTQLTRLLYLFMFKSIYSADRFCCHLIK